MSSRRKVIVIGSGGREHALALRLLESDSVAEVGVLPGNAGTQQHEASGRRIYNVPSSGELGQDVLRERPDLVVVGPEAPLCAGIVDELAAAGIVSFGPTRLAAELEGSKAFMKAFCTRHAIPTADYVVLQGMKGAEAAIAAFPEVPVVKADGLCAGKGVVVPETREEARTAAFEMLSGKRFGAAGAKVVLERRLAGAEASVHALCDGERFLMLAAAQDHKRIFDGDRGPNTGGMGTYAPAPIVTPELAARIAERVFAPALAGMAADGRPFRGALFAGVMIDESGDFKLLEFNVRFGDPETQVLMATLQGDLGEALAAAAEGRMAPSMLRANGEHAVCVVLAAGGYPEVPRKGDVISGLEAAAQCAGVRVLHAGTARNAAGTLVTDGGRVFGITATGASLQQAHDRAYAAAALIEFSGKQYRRDIAARAL
jgi:phosphoribosylamine--glycine ligase